MSDFWANKLAASQSAPPRQEPVQPPASTPWWAEAAPPDPGPQQTNVSHGPTVTPHPIQPATSTKAQSARSSAVCPGCASGNYFAVVGSKPRCYDCGYPVVQQFSGAGMPSSRGETATPTHQLPPGGYHPEMIQGHIG